MRLVVTGRISPRKGQEVAVDALERLRERGRPATLDLVGAVFPGYEWCERDLRARVPVLEWLMWQMGGLGPMPGQVHHFLGQPEGPARDYGVERYGKETRRLYGVLDKRLAGREFVATEGEPSVADFAILGWAWRHERHLVPFDDLPNLAAWYDRMMARPATKRGFEIPLS